MGTEGLEVYLVKRSADDVDTEVDVYGDYSVAAAAAALCGTSVEAQPVLGVAFLDELKAGLDVET